MKQWKKILDYSISKLSTTGDQIVLFSFLSLLLHSFLIWNIIHYIFSSFSLIHLFIFLSKHPLKKIFLFLFFSLFNYVSHCFASQLLTPLIDDHFIVFRRHTYGCLGLQPLAFQFGHLFAITLQYVYTVYNVRFLIALCAWRRLIETLHSNSK